MKLVFLIWWESCLDEASSTPELMPFSGQLESALQSVESTSYPWTNTFYSKAISNFGCPVFLTLLLYPIRGKAGEVSVPKVKY